jgi:hypothetical protein
MGIGVSDTGVTAVFCSDLCLCAPKLAIILPRVGKVTPQR